MRRKQQQSNNPLSPNALSSDSDAPKSPASTGAMDDLLQKLRAAKPEARDQRDRRRRARLKDRHQVRVASGQKMPEIGVNVEDEEGEGAEEGKKGILSLTSETGESENSTITGSTGANGEVDIADRAAAMLEGLQGGTGGGLNKDGSLSVRRRRESADTERQRRRNRRQQASSARTDGEDGPLSPAIPEEGEAQFFPKDSADDDAEEGDGRIIVSPPSPETKGGRELPTPPPES